MGEQGRLKPADWGKFMPAHNSLSGDGPWYYRDTEMVMVEFETDREAVLDILPSELELIEPASAFMVIEINHWTTLGPYGEVYVGVMCSFEGQAYAYVPGVYVTGENSQIVGREVWGFGKKRPHRIEVKTHDNGLVEASMDVLPGDGALRAVMKPLSNLPADAVAGVPLICLKIIPDAEGGKPALAQLVTVSFTAKPIVGSDGRAEVYAGPGTFKMDAPSDVNFPIKKLGGMMYARFNADLPFGKVLKTYKKNEL